MTQDKGGPEQKQNSRQSAKQGESKPDNAPKGSPAPSGLGSSQKQDQEQRRGERPSAGTPDVERGGGTPGDVERGASGQSLVNDPVGAYKERP